MKAGLFLVVDDVGVVVVDNVAVVVVVTVAVVQCMKW